MPVRSDHWDSVYGARPIDELSWFQAEPTMSLELIRSLRPRPTSMIDVGAGASCLADRMVDDGVGRVTVLDISEQALAAVSERLGDHPGVSFVVADITDWNPQQTWELWHDRAVLHFLVDDAQQSAYFATLRQLVKPGGHVIIAAFSLDGATRCSGLPVRNYSREMLAEALGSEFALIEAFDYVYHMPSGDPRPFVYTLFRRA